MPSTGHSLRVEILAGITTFITMAYVIVVNPAVLQSTGMNAGAVFVATCLSAAFGSLLMGFIARYPIALAPSMGLNAYFTFVVVQHAGYPWQVGLGIVLMAGLGLFILTLAGVRKFLLHHIPDTFKTAITAGIGLFLAVIGLRNLGFIHDTHLWHFNWHAIQHPTTWMAIIGIILLATLNYLRIFGATLLSIFIMTTLGIYLGLSKFHGLIAMPPSLASTFWQWRLPHFTDAHALEMMFSFLFVALFDSTGTLIGVLQQAGIKMTPQDGRRINGAFFADSMATMVGACLGTSTVGSYLESISGVRAGGRTGWTPITTATLFLLALFFAPLVKTVPIYATAPVLFFVASLMVKNLAHIHWRDLSESIPAIVITLGIPLTFSLALGIGLGFASYLLIKIISGRRHELSAPVWILGLICILYLIHYFK